MRITQKPQAITFSIHEGSLPDFGVIEFRGEELGSVALTFYHPLGQVDLTVADQQFVEATYRNVMGIYGAHGSKPMAFEAHVLV